MIITIDSIKALIRALQETTSLAYIALDQGQCDEYLDELKHPPIKTPALLIAPDGEERCNEDKEWDRYRADLSLRLYVNLPLIASSAAPDRHLESYARYLALIDEVIKAAKKEGWRLDGYKVGARVESLQETRIQLAREEWAEG